MRKRDPVTPPPTVAIALFVGFVLMIGFVSLVSIVIPGAGMMLLAILVLSAFFVAQYFLWGRWLHRYVVDQERKSTSKSEDALTAKTDVLPNDPIDP